MFEATFTNTTLEEEAKKICGEDVSCLFDVAATGRLEIGMATMNAVEMVNTIENVTKPSNDLIIILQLPSYGSNIIAILFCVQLFASHPAVKGFVQWITCVVVTVAMMETDVKCKVTILLIKNY